MQIDRQNIRTANSCEVCNTSLSAVDVYRQPGNDSMHCNSPVCVGVVQKKETLSGLEYESYLRFTRLSVMQRRNRDSLQKKQFDEIHAKERSQEKIIKDFVSSSIASAAGKTTVISIPSGPSGVSAPAKGRKFRYIEYLRECMDLATAQTKRRGKQNTKNTKKLVLTRTPDQASVNESNKTPLLCSTCKGGCCTLGDNRAHITADTLSQKINDHPELSPEEILQNYISRIPKESISNSCINHTSTGCALPRDWRSNTCNEFLCEPAKIHHSKSEKQEEHIIIQRDCTHWNRYALDCEVNVTAITYIDPLGKTTPIDPSILNT